MKQEKGSAQKTDNENTADTTKSDRGKSKSSKRMKMG